MSAEKPGPLLRLGVSFFLFGVINNVLYVIILSAALDLVPTSTPKGIILFCNIAPALLAKIGWPYLLKGRIHYARRLFGCCTLSVAGMIVVAAFESLPGRLLGISFASFSSGLGELTFLQLSTTYHPPSVGGHSVGYFASGTGAAGLLGAFLWWEVRSLGVRVGVGLSAVLPFITPLTYLLVLPRPSAFASVAFSSLNDGDSDGALPVPYTSLPTIDEDTIEQEQERFTHSKTDTVLSLAEKWRLAKPLLLRYMLPLFCVYLFEYTINQGIAPTLIYPVPSGDSHSVLGNIIHSIRDYYPLWQLVYQTTVFLSRSTISLGLPPLPSRLLSLPAVVQALILLTLMYESAIGFFSDASEGINVFMVFLLISLEGICGGLAYVNVFYRINQEQSKTDPSIDPERAKQEKEFKIGSIGLSDSLGILIASLVAMPTEIELCNAQVRRGKMLCRGL
ncbi:small molecule transporter [Heterobasidion irregulare TC 32-1]|uniref:Protein BTN n=1 Tax=Heterobasidion irregulare (strain TC 32-1) TaxID=747525 RepID=W4JUY9_HETIT|nr:small molecule transporter [Heterobasidion irregulare TC 32-1]ETW77378.1 small molecule transporter [Heterobasidion irregulare TC 32-1]